MQSDKPISQPRTPRGRLLAAGSAAAIVLVGLGAFSLIPAANNHVEAASPQKFAAVQSSARPAPPRMLESSAPFSFADLVERVSPAVVTVTVEEKADQSQGDADLPDDLPPPFRDFFRQFGQGNGQPIVPRKAVAMGSGFIIDRSGLVVTNNHVVKGATKITVKLPDGRQFTAKPIGADEATDVALIKIKSDKPLPTVEFGDDRQLRVGDWVVAVGNPFGLSNTVTAGIVSSIGRNIGTGPYTDFIQIDAPINRGNSGGPTFDLRGQVVGMNSMIFSPSGGSVGIGFAIPASTIHDVIAQLQAHGHVERGWLGVQIQSITPEIASSLGIKNPKGAIGASVVAGGPAEKAGFRQGDVVVALDGKAIEDNRDLTRRVAALPADSTATFSIVRDGASKTLTARIGHRKDEQVASASPGDRDGKPASAKAMGLGLASVTEDARREFNLGADINGVLITKVDPNSDAADKGLQPGDVLVAVGNRPVHTPQEVQGRVADAHASGKKSVLLLVTGANGPRYVAVDLGQT
jgi:serine protease Do